MTEPAGGGGAAPGPTVETNGEPVPEAPPGYMLVPIHDPTPDELAAGLREHADREAERAAAAEANIELARERAAAEIAGAEQAAERARADADAAHKAAARAERAAGVTPGGDS